MTRTRLGTKSKGECLSAGPPCLAGSLACKYVRACTFRSRKFPWQCSFSPCLYGCSSLRPEPRSQEDNHKAKKCSPFINNKAHMLCRLHMRLRVCICRHTCTRADVHALRSARTGGHTDVPLHTHRDAEYAIQQQKRSKHGNCLPLHKALRPLSRVLLDIILVFLQLALSIRKKGLHKQARGKDRV